MTCIGLSPLKIRNFIWEHSAAVSTSWYLSTKTVMLNSSPIRCRMGFLRISCFPSAKTINGIYGSVRRTGFASSVRRKNASIVLMNAALLFRCVSVRRPLHRLPKGVCFSVPVAVSLFSIRILFIRAAMFRLSYSPS